MLDQIIIFCAQYLPFLILGIAVIFFARLEKSRRISALVLFATSSVIAFIADKILNRLIESPRPFMVNDIVPLFPHSADNGFPSEHVLFAMVIASVVFAYSRKLGIVLGILALVIGLARVAAYVHHPIDVLGGMLIAFVAVSGTFYVLSRPRFQAIFGEINDKKPLF